MYSLYTRPCTPKKSMENKYLVLLMPACVFWLLPCNGRTCSWAVQLWSWRFFPIRRERRRQIYRDESYFFKSWHFPRRFTIYLHSFLTNGKANDFCKRSKNLKSFLKHKQGWKKAHLFLLVIHKHFSNSFKGQWLVMKTTWQQSVRISSIYGNLDYHGSIVLLS